MWYWVHKAEGFSAYPFLVVYYALRRIPFSMRCRKCGGWLSEQQYMRSGLCRGCHEKMALDASNEYSILNANSYLPKTNLSGTFVLTRVLS